MGKAVSMMWWHRRNHVGAAKLRRKNPPGDLQSKVFDKLENGIQWIKKRAPGGSSRATSTCACVKRDSKESDRQ